MADTLQLIIVTPETTLYKGTAEIVTLPGALGSFSILPGHAPLISILEKGVVRYVVQNEEKKLNIASGFVEVKENVISVCAEL